MESLRRMSIKRVASMVKSFEDAFRHKKIDHVEMVEEGCPRKKKTRLQVICKQTKRRCKHWLKTSRFSGIPFSLVYGVFVYLYITYMIFPGQNNNSTSSSMKDKLNNNSTACSFGNTDESIISGKYNISNQPPAMLLQNTSNATSHNKTEHGGIHSKNNNNNNNTDENSNLTNSDISLMASLCFTVALATMSLFSKHTRCIMVLVLPGVITGRGRAFIMTAIMGLLIEGPVNGINYNLNQVVESNACMYQSMRNMACSYTSQMQRSLKYMVSVVKEKGEEMRVDFEEATAKAKRLTGKAKEELRNQKELLSNRLSKLKSDMNALQEFLEDVDKPCQFGESALGSVEGFFGDVFGEIGSWFSKRRRRRRRDVEICGAAVPFPDIVVTPELDVESIQELNDWLKDVIPDYQMTSHDIPDLEELVSAPSVVDIREKILNTVSDVFTIFKEYLQSLKKTFVVISMLFLILLSYRYLQIYYSDDSFDNKFIDNNIRNLWRHSNLEKLTPLRHWELNARYQVSASPKLSRQELKRIFMKILPTILVSVAVLFIMLGDYALAELLSTLAANGKFAVSFEGMEQGKNLTEVWQAASMSQQHNETDIDMKMSTFKLEKIDLSTDPCLPHPIYTSRRKTICIVVLLLTVALSCFFDAYVTRIRPQICNLFYEDHARERGEYLYEKLKSGRNIRRLRLRMIVSRELKRRKKLQEFSWISRTLTSLLEMKKNLRKQQQQQQQQQRQVNCPGCSWTVKLEETKIIKIEETPITVEARICNDCALDF